MNIRTLFLQAALAPALCSGQDHTLRFGRLGTRRTTMNVVTGMASLMAETPLTNEPRDYA